MSTFILNSIISWAEETLCRSSLSQGYAEALTNLVEAIKGVQRFH